MSEGRGGSREFPGDVDATLAEDFQRVGFRVENDFVEVALVVWILEEVEVFERLREEK